MSAPTSESFMTSELRTESGRRSMAPRPPLGSVSSRTSVEWTSLLMMSRSPTVFWPASGPSTA
jgi:hypothetical protein